MMNRIRPNAIRYDKQKQQGEPFPAGSTQVDRIYHYAHMELGAMDMKDDDDLFDLQRELFLERKKKFGHREDAREDRAASAKYTPIDTGEACVGG